MEVATDEPATRKAVHPNLPATVSGKQNRIP